MTRGGFRHLIVLDGGEVAGIVSVRDIVRCWSQERAADELVG
jgi:signal-transduction protein with cAMP-binding, CBS, and nucleotidyltransferase domain